ncbi:MAG TPA: glycoside hydrolase family 6 protein [Solirubrobacteraceae bacterium]|jgi:endoglucanase|nr:glycoside hydrolase family 6 protein [Solirubrobacteraceae bacterium]
MTIFSRRSPLFALAGLWLALVIPTAAQAAAPHDGGSAGTVGLDQAAYTAHENQGYLTITIQRTGDLSGEEHVGYGVKRQDAQPGIDFDTIGNRTIDFAPGQSTYTFNVRIIDQGMAATPVHALAYLFSSWPDGLGPNSNSPITILHDDPIEPRDAANPLGVPGPYNGNLIAGTKFYVDPNSGAAKAQAQYRHSNPAMSALLGDLASEPGAHRFYMWNMGSNVSGQVSHYLEGTQAQQPGSTVMLSTYTLVHDHCGYTATPAMAARYEDFMHQVAEGIGNYHVVFFLELDSLITAPCLTHPQLSIREAELKYAISALEADPHVVVYLDAGAADAVKYRQMATWLRGSGIAQAQGFFLNSTHFDWTTSEIHYGQQISRLLGGAHFVVNTGSNGKGPLAPKRRVGHGNEVLCNPPGRGLGPLSMSGGIAQQTNYAATDGLLWFSNPGGSGGQCVPGAPPTGVFWPQRAAMLARNWVNKVAGPKFNLLESPFAAAHGRQ